MERLEVAEAWYLHNTSRVLRLHTPEPKSRDNLEIAHGLHTREIDNLLNILAFSWN
jgi:hypothetical protein